MAIKEIVCESCEASFTIEYEMLGHQYKVKVCPFCGSELDEDGLHEIEVIDDDNPYEI
jgi:rRNA maturation endonuclease Nob1|tara:strand:- start:714 stop:887 length:174 start_codon:yes stop_codon:yes gene_type:complete